LYLGGNKLEGNISPAVGSLASLEVLDLSRNLLSGSIPLLAGEFAVVIQLIRLGMTLRLTKKFYLFTIAHCQIH
jgi:hypothetical protein